MSEVDLEYPDELLELHNELRYAVRLLLKSCR